MSERAPPEAVKFWWPTPVMQRTFVPAAGAAVTNDAALQAWIEAMAKDLVKAIARPPDKLPDLVLKVADYEFMPIGQVPRRAAGAVLAGVFCFDPGPVSVERPEAAALTFEDPRPGAEMIPGTAAPGNPVRMVRLGINGLILFPGWLAQGHAAPVDDRHPRWLRVWFGPGALKDRALI